MLKVFLGLGMVWVFKAFSLEGFLLMPQYTIQAFVVQSSLKTRNYLMLSLSIITSSVLNTRLTSYGQMRNFESFFICGVIDVPAGGSVVNRQKTVNVSTKNVLE